MKKIIPILLLGSILGCSNHLKLTDEAKLLELIPSDATLLERVEGEPEFVVGDLNHDGLTDIAAIIEIEDQGTVRREVIVIFKTNKNTHEISLQTDKFVLNEDEGGVWGDPLESISIEEGALVINHYGGSNWRWYTEQKLIYKDNNWYLSYIKNGTYFIGEQTSDEADEAFFDLLTGNFSISERDKNGGIIVNEGKNNNLKLLNINAVTDDWIDFKDLIK